MEKLPRILMSKEMSSTVQPQVTLYLHWMMNDYTWYLLEALAMMQSHEIHLHLKLKQRKQIKMQQSLHKQTVKSMCSKLGLRYQQHHHHSLTLLVIS
jgi:hypothetical protein